MFGKIFSAAVTVVTIFLCLAGLVYYVAGFCGIRSYIVLSSSMEPVMPSGALAFINTNDKEVQVGDIISFEIAASREEGTGKASEKTEHSLTVTHRVADIRGDDIFTKGDANETADPSPVQADSVVGKYLFCIPKLGLFMTKKGRYFFVAGAGAVVLLNVAAVLLIAGKDGRKS